MEPLVFPTHDRALPRTGLYANPFPIGTAILLLPGFAVAHGLTRFTGIGSVHEADGFSLPYGVAVFWSLWVWATAGLFLTHAWMRRWWPRWVALPATLLAWLASGAALYQFPDILNNHTPELFAFPLFLLTWDRWLARPAVGRALAAAAACGLLFLVRWQLVLWPVVFWLFALARAPRARTLWVLPIPAVMLAAPQLVAWRIIYGEWLLIPQGEGYIQWARPMVFPLLFSTYRGWITWTPIVAVGLAGLALSVRQRAVMPLLVGLVLQVFISSIVSDWHGAFGFGARRLTHAVPLIAFGVAAVLHRIAGAERRRVAFAAAALSLLAVWNGLFLMQYVHHLIPYHRALTWHELIGDKLHLRASLERRFAVRNAMYALDESRAAERAGQVMQAAKSLSLGDQWLARARRVDPLHEDVFLAAASLAMERRDPERALREYGTCLEVLDVDRGQILTSMGVCALYGGDAATAVELAHWALREQPGYPHAEKLLEDARDGVRDEAHRLFFY